jgi:hypothetical protein
MAARWCITGVVRPGDRKPGDIQAIYLIEIRIAGVAGIAAGGFPVGVGAGKWPRRRSSAGDRDES